MLDSSVSTDVVFEDQSVEVTLVSRYKGSKGNLDRIAFIGKSLVRANRHFYKKTMIRCKTQDPLKSYVCCQKLGAPEQRFAAIIFRYSANQDGEPDYPDKCSGQFFIWTLTEKMYLELGMIDRCSHILDRGFEDPSRDLILRHQDNNFRKVQIIQCRYAHWKTNREWYDLLSRKAVLLRPKIEAQLGKFIEEFELKALLGIPYTGVVERSPTDISLDDVISNSPSREPAPKMSDVLDKPVEVEASLEPGHIANGGPVGKDRDQLEREKLDPDLSDILAKPEDTKTDNATDILAAATEMTKTAEEVEKARHYSGGGFSIELE